MNLSALPKGSLAAGLSIKSTAKAKKEGKNMNHDGMIKYAVAGIL